jgi:hypothetical protein
VPRARALGPTLCAAAAAQAGNACAAVRLGYQEGYCRLNARERGLAVASVCLPAGRGRSYLLVGEPCGHWRRDAVPQHPYCRNAKNRSPPLRGAFTARVTAISRVGSSEPANSSPVRSVPTGAENIFSYPMGSNTRKPSRSAKFFCGPDLPKDVDGGKAGAFSSRNREWRAEGRQCPYLRQILQDLLQAMLASLSGDQRLL